MPIGNALSFAAAVFLLTLVPGPSVMFVISRAVTLGRRAALSTVLGNSLGLLSQGVLVAVGLGTLVTDSIAVFTTIKLAGAAYLVWLGIQSIRHRHELAHGLDDPAAPTLTRSGIVRQGFLVGITNPKAAVFYSAMLPQFVERDAGRVPGQMLILVVIAFCVSLVSDSVWGMAAAAARGWFARRPARLSKVVAGGGVAIVGLGITAAATGRSS